MSVKQPPEHAENRRELPLALERFPVNLQASNEDRRGCSAISVEDRNERPLGDRQGLPCSELAQALGIGSSELQQHYRDNVLPRPLERQYLQRDLPRLVSCIDRVGLPLDAPWAAWARRQRLTDDDLDPVHNGDRWQPPIRPRGTRAEKRLACETFALLNGHLGEQGALSLMRQFAGLTIRLPSENELAELLAARPAS